MPSTTPMARATSSVRSAAEGVGRREVDEVVGPLAHDLRVAGGTGRATEHAERTVADLVAVAVRTVEDVAGPPLPESGHVRQLVTQTSRDQQPPGGDSLPVREQHPEPVPAVRHELGDGAGDDLASVARTSSRPAASSSVGGSPSRDRYPCMWAAGALRGAPPSTTRTVRRARERTSAADNPAAPPPMTTTSYRLMTQGWTRNVHAPTIVAVSGNRESDVPRGEHVSDHRRHARAGRAATQEAPHPAPDHADRPRGHHRDLQEHVVPARDHQRRPTLELLLALSQAYRVPLDDLVAAPDGGATPGSGSSPAGSREGR